MRQILRRLWQGLKAPAADATRSPAPLPVTRDAATRLLKELGYNRELDSRVVDDDHKITCPGCKAQLNAATRVAGRMGEENVGDAGVCFHCGMIFEVVKQGGRFTIVKMSNATWNKIHPESKAQVMEVVDRIKAQHTGRDEYGWKVEDTCQPSSGTVH